MAKNKLKRYRDVDAFPNVTQVSQVGMEASMDASHWRRVFGTDALDLTLELACGKGEYTVELARRHPERQFIGVDIKGARLWIGAGTALQEGLCNAHFLRVWIDHLAGYIPSGAVSQIWIVFPDPYLREKQTAKRLSSPRFLALYRQLLTPEGVVHFKTDSPELHAFTLEQADAGHLRLLAHLEDIHAPGVRESAADDASIPEQLWTVRTYYEGMHLEKGRTIRYLQFRPI
jgi:tRNA (guanine-N7-)-methyltransferase